jgi:hypothetical protein
MLALFSLELLILDWVLNDWNVCFDWRSGSAVCFLVMSRQCPMVRNRKRPNLSKGASLLVVKEGLEPSTPGL